MLELGAIVRGHDEGRVRVMGWGVPVDLTSSLLGIMIEVGGWSRVKVGKDKGKGYELGARGYRYLLI